MRRVQLVVAVAAVTIASSVLATATAGASGKADSSSRPSMSTPPPTATAFVAAPASLSAAGGKTALSASVANGKTCVLSSSPALHGLPSTLKCSAISKDITLPKNTTKLPKFYTFTLTVKGTTTIKSIAMTAVLSSSTKKASKIEESGKISANTLWTPTLAGTYSINSTLTIAPGATLVIAPGTVVKTLSDGACYANSNLCVRGTLKAVGTTQNPVVFTSLNDNSVGGVTGDGDPQPGDWWGIGLVPSSTSDIEHAKVNYAQYGVLGGEGAALSVTVKSDSFAQDEIYAVSLSTAGSTPVVSGNKSVDSGSDGSSYFVSSTHLNFGLLSGNTATGSGINAFAVQGAITTSTMFASSLPWLIDTNLSVPTGTTLTIAPGAVVKAEDSGTCFDDSNLCVQGSLKAVGTSAQPIVFTSVNDNSVGGATGNGDPQPGDWWGIGLAIASTSDIEHARVDYGQWGVDGDQGGALTTTIKSDSFQYENSYGVDISSAASSPVVASNTAVNAGQYPFYVSSTHLNLGALAGNSSTGSAGQNAMEIQGVVATSTMSSGSLPWLIVNGLTVPNGATLTISAGTVVKAVGSGSCFDSSSLCVEGTLKAIGTGLNPITFTSVNDNSIGGITGDGDPQPGDWWGIGIATASNSDIEYATIEYAQWGVEGDEGGALTTKITNDTFGEESEQAVDLSTAASTPTVSGNVAATQESSSLPVFEVTSNALNFNDLSGNASSGPGLNAFAITGDASSSTMDASMTWYVDDSLDVPVGKTLTIDADAVIKSNGTGDGTCSDAANICVDGALIANGTSLSPITFTSIDDNSIGGTTGTGSPTPGEWVGVDGPGSFTVTHVNVDYASVALP